MIAISSDDFKDMAVVAGWLLIVIGWFVTTITANKRERRKEARTEIDACAKMAHDLLALSREYYTKAADDESIQPTAAKIRFEVQRLFIRVERLENKYPQFDIRNSVAELYDSVTGGDFDSKSRSAVEYDSELLLKIESDIHMLIDQLEDGFFRAFP